MWLKIIGLFLLNLRLFIYQYKLLIIVKLHLDYSIWQFYNFRFWQTCIKCSQNSILIVPYNCFKNNIWKKLCRDKIDLSLDFGFILIHSIRLQTFKHGGSEFTIPTHQWANIWLLRQWKPCQLPSSLQILEYFPWWPKVTPCKNHFENRDKIS